MQAAAKTLSSRARGDADQAAQASRPLQRRYHHEGVAVDPEAARRGARRRCCGERTGIFTSGIVATQAGHQIALFFTGVRHAGENLAAVLARRSADLPPPIQMCDGLSRNIPSEFDTVIVVNASPMPGDKYVELTETFPAEVRFVLETLREVYITDARARNEGLTRRND